MNATSLGEVKISVGRYPMTGFGMSRTQQNYKQVWSLCESESCVVTEADVLIGVRCRLIHVADFDVNPWELAEVLTYLGT